VLVVELEMEEVAEAVAEEVLLPSVLLPDIVT